MKEGWEKTLISIGYEVEMKTKDDTYPVDFDELLENIHKLEEQIRAVVTGGQEK